MHRPAFPQRTPSRSATAFKFSVLFLGVLFLCLSSSSAFAQRFDEVWYFGDSAGLDFRSGSAVSFSGSKLSTSEGAAVATDPVTHQVLFYTDGRSVWDGNNQVLVARAFHGGESATQAVLVVPAPERSGVYYLFTSGQVEDLTTDTRGIEYSVLDLSVPGLVVQLNRPLLRPASERLTAVRHCNGRDWWIIAHGAYNSSFDAYLLTPSGLAANPVISMLPPKLKGTDNNIGYLAASPDGTRLAMAVYGLDVYAGFYSFDASTGVVGDETSLQITGVPYGIAFSPDGTKLYVTLINAGELVQYDLLAGTPAGIVASRTLIHTSADPSPSFGAIAPGPDGRLYVARSGMPGIGVVDQPNVAGVGCGYRHEGIALVAGLSGLGLPNVVVALGGTAASASSSDTTICLGGSVQLHAGAAARYEWSPPSGLSCSDCADPIASPTATTTYSVASFGGNGCARYDTIRVVVDTVVRAGIDGGGTICKGSEATLVARVPAGARVRWSPSASLDCDTCAVVVATPTQTTTYTLEAWDADGCKGAATTVVQVDSSSIPVEVRTAGPLCAGEEGELTAAVLGGCDSCRIRWVPSTGLGCDTCFVTSARPSTSTLYTAEVRTPHGCVGSGSTTLVVTQASTVEAVVAVDTSIAAGDSLDVPVRLSGIQPGSSAGELGIEIRYNPLVLRLRSVLPSGAIAGWPSVVENNNWRQGVYTARFVGPNGLRLDSDGEILRLRFESYYGGAQQVSSVEIASLYLVGMGCTALQQVAGRVVLDSICGLSLRMIELLPAGRLVQASPQPANGTALIDLQLEERGQVQLEVVDNVGNAVVLYEGELDRGRRAVAVDVRRLVPGAYTLVGRFGGVLAPPIPFVVFH